MSLFGFEMFFLFFSIWNILKEKHLHNLLMRHCLDDFRDNIHHFTVRCLSVLPLCKGVNLKMVTQSWISPILFDPEAKISLEMNEILLLPQSQLPQVHSNVSAVVIAQFQKLSNEDWHIHHLPKLTPIVLRVFSSQKHSLLVKCIQTSSRSVTSRCWSYN